MLLRPFHPMDLGAIGVQARQEHDYPFMTEALAQRLHTEGPAWTAEINGRVLACGGLWNCHGVTAHGWAYFVNDIGPAMIGFTRLARRAIAATDCRRIEATAPADWPEANRWLAMLGFEHRTLLRLWGPLAIDMNLWEIVR